MHGFPTHRVYSTYLRIGIGSAWLIVHTLLLSSHCRDRNKRYVHLSSAVINVGCMTLFFWELYGIPWQPFVIVTTVLIAQCVCTLSFIAYTILKTMPLSVPREAKCNKNDTNNFEPSRERTGSIIGGSIMANMARRFSFSSRTVSLSHMLQNQHNQRNGHVSTKTKFTVLGPLFLYLVMGSILLFLVLEENDTVYANVLMIAHGSMVLCLTLSFNLMFCRFRGMVNASIREFANKKGKVYERRVHELQAVTRKISKLLLAVMVVGLFAAFCAFWRASFDILERNDLSYSEYYEETFRSESWQVHDLLLYICLVCTIFWLYWAWVPIRPFQQSSQTVYTNNTPNRSIRSRSQSHNTPPRGYGNSLTLDTKRIRKSSRAPSPNISKNRRKSRRALSISLHKSATLNPVSSQQPESNNYTASNGTNLGGSHRSDNEENLRFHSLSRTSAPNLTPTHVSVLASVSNTDAGNNSLVAVQKSRKLQDIVAMMESSNFLGTSNSMSTITIIQTSPPRPQRPQTKKIMNA